jgi:hypothetical protein
MAQQIKKKYLSSEVISYFDDQIDAVESGLSSEVMRSTGVEGGLNSRLTTAEGEIDVLQSDLDAAELAISSEIMRATGVEGGLNSRLGIAEGEIDTLQFDLDAAESAISGEIMRATGVEGGINSRLVIAESEIDTLQFDLDAAEAAISAEVMRATGVEGSLQSQINNVLSNLDGAALDSLTEVVSAFQAADSTLNGAITSLASSASTSLSTEQSARIAADSVLSGEISALSLDVVDLDGYAQDIRNDLDSLQSAFSAQVDGPSFNKMKVVISSELGFIDLAHSAIENSVVVCVARLMAHKDEDFSLSVVGGVSRLTWIGSMANPSGAEKIEAGDSVFVTYAY